MLYLHKNNKKNDAFESEELTKRVNEKVHEEEGLLDKQHGSVSGERQLHCEECGVTTSRIVTRNVMLRSRSWSQQSMLALGVTLTAGYQGKPSLSGSH